MSPETVEAYSGYTYGENPRFFHWEEERLEIVRIHARWRIPGGKGWRAETDDGRLFEITYCEGEDQWSIRSL